jgi:heme A synthase
MDFSNIFGAIQSAPIVGILLAGVFTIAALIYNVQQADYSQEAQKDNVFVLTLLSAIMILGMMMVVVRL